jgi:hypothetical protein
MSTDAQPVYAKCTGPPVSRSSGSREPSFSLIVRASWIPIVCAMSKRKPRAIASASRYPRSA